MLCILNANSAGSVNKAVNAKVGVFTCGIDIAQTETKGTVLLKNSEELLNFSKGEEQHMEKVLLLSPYPGRHSAD